MVLMWVNLALFVSFFPYKFSFNNNVSDRVKNTCVFSPFPCSIASTAARLGGVWSPFACER